MALPPWFELGVFMAAMLIVVMFVVTVAGHFPVEHRAKELTTPAGALLLWTTSLITTVTALVAIFFVYRLIPTYAAIIGGGFMILIAPYVLHPFPDRFVNGRLSLILLAAAAAILDLGMLARLS